MKLQLKAKHFRRTKYTNNKDCAIAKALKEKMKEVKDPRAGKVNVGIGHVTIGSHWEEETYIFSEPYTAEMFGWDWFRSLFVPGSTVLRTVEIEAFKFYPGKTELSSLTVDALLRKSKVPTEELKIPV